MFGGIFVRPDVIHERVFSFQDATVQGAELSLHSSEDAHNISGNFLT